MHHRRFLHVPRARDLVLTDLFVSEAVHGHGESVASEDLIVPLVAVFDVLDLPRGVALLLPDV